MLNTWTVRSKSELGVVYVVTRDDTGNFSCSCPDFEYRHHVCKHIRKIKMQVAGENQKNKLVGFTQLDQKLMNAPVLFGLTQQGHIPTIERMLEEGATWEQIGEEIGWCPETAKEHYIWYKEQEKEAHRILDKALGEGDSGD